jgi:hypothetical protein
MIRGCMLILGCLREDWNGQYAGLQAAGPHGFKLYSRAEYHAARCFMDVLPKPLAETGTMPALLRQWLASQRNGEAA